MRDGEQTKAKPIQMRSVSRSVSIGQRIVPPAASSSRTTFLDKCPSLQASLLLRSDPLASFSWTLPFCPSYICHNMHPPFLACIPQPHALPKINWPLTDCTSFVQQDSGNDVKHCQIEAAKSSMRGRSLEAVFCRNGSSIRQRARVRSS